MQFWTSLATLITAVAALLTILEMRWQRHSGYLPDLVVRGESFRLRGNAAGLLDIAVDNAQSGPDAVVADPHLALHCANVGVAHAKDVQIEWEYDTLAFVGLIAELNSQLGKSILLENSELHIMLESQQSVHMVARQNRTGLTPLPPSPAGAETRLRLPRAYEELLRLYLKAATEVERPGRGSDIVPIALKLVIRYRDIGGNQHVRRLVIHTRIEWIATGHSAGGGTQVLRELQGYLEVREA